MRDGEPLKTSLGGRAGTPVGSWAFVLDAHEQDADGTHDRYLAIYPPCPDCGTNPRDRQKYHVATLRYGRHASARASTSAGVGRSFNP